MFEGRDLLIVTKHKKERVIAPLLEKHLKVACFTLKKFNTDDFGTFSGEIERKDEPLETVRKKCLTGMHLANCDLAVASEGSFGPHPSLFFVPSDSEIIVLIDKKNNFEIIAHQLSTETNFSGREINSYKELCEFAKIVKFPSHALIIKKEKNDFSEMIKGITTWDKLFSAYQYFTQENKSIFVETDMRALYNPTRMKVIKKTTEILVKNINSKCPKCHTPGFVISDIKKGLPCEQCHLPTQSALSHIYVCKKCNYVKENEFPNKRIHEDPMYCGFCNP